MVLGENKLSRTVTLILRLRSVLLTPITLHFSELTAANSNRFRLTMMLQNTVDEWLPLQDPQPMLPTAHDWTMSSFIDGMKTPPKNNSVNNQPATATRKKALWRHADTSIDHTTATRLVTTLDLIIITHCYHLSPCCNPLAQSQL
jgi:hypothetical protein